MTRYNIFNQIHKGLRVVLYETATLIQQTDFSHKALSQPTISQIEKTLGYFDFHAEHENGYIFPLIAKADPAIIQQFTGAHDQDEVLAQQLRILIAAWKAAADGAAAAKTGREILYAFNGFVAFNLDHMNKEELVLNEVLWSHYTDEEIGAVEHAIISSIPPELLLEESRFMMRGVNDRELVGWLTGVKLNAPAPVYELYVQMMEEEITPVRSQAVVNELAAV